MQPNQKRKVIDDLLKIGYSAQDDEWVHKLYAILSDENKEKINRYVQTLQEAEHTL